MFKSCKRVVTKALWLTPSIRWLPRFRYIRALLLRLLNLNRRFMLDYKKELRLEKVITNFSYQKYGWISLIYIPKITKESGRIPSNSGNPKFCRSPSPNSRNFKDYELITQLASMRTAFIYYSDLIHWVMTKKLYENEFGSLNCYGKQ